MSGGEIIYFELAAAGTLIETDRKEVGGDIASLDIAPIPEGRQRSRFLAVGGSDSTVPPHPPSPRLLWIPFKFKTHQEQPRGICLLYMGLMWITISPPPPV